MEISRNFALVRSSNLEKEVVRVFGSKKDKNADVPKHLRKYKMARESLGELKSLSNRMAREVALQKHQKNLESKVLHAESSTQEMSEKNHPTRIVGLQPSKDRNFTAMGT
jgi:hypothetical protein